MDCAAVKPGTRSGLTLTSRRARPQDIQLRRVTAFAGRSEHARRDEVPHSASCGPKTRRDFLFVGERGGPVRTSLRG